MRDNYNYVNIARRRQARRQTRVRMLIIAVSAVTIFVLSLLLGHYLQDKVEALAPRGEIPEQLLSGELPADTSDASQVSIMASDLALDALSDSAAIAQIVEELQLGSREAVSLHLRDDAGEVFYSSQVAQNLTGQPAAGVDLSLLLPALREADIYTSAVFGVTAFRETDTVSRDLVRAYELSLCAEIGESGVDELLLTGLPVTVDTLDDIVTYLNEVRALLPDGVMLAVAIPRELIEQPSGTVLVKQLSLSADTVALDLHSLAAEGGAGDSSEAATFTEKISAIFSDASLYFSKYNMRVLISAPDDATFSSFRQALEVNAIQNWQVIG